MLRKVSRKGKVMAGLSDGYGAGYATLETKVSVLETDIAGVSNRIDNLDVKFDKVMTGFASEFRTALASLSSQLSEKNKTPWGILISGAGVVLTFVALLGHQTLSPLTSNIEQLSHEVVPRKEIEARYAFTDSRMAELRAEIASLRQHEYDALTHKINNLETENRTLKFGPK